MPKAYRVHFAFGRWARGTSAQQPDAKYSYFSARSEVCSRPKRNKWRGPAQRGRRPFMPDSALNRRSEALGGWKANNASFGHQIIPRTLNRRLLHLIRGLISP